MGFGSLANFWVFGLGLPWTEKMGLYNVIQGVAAYGLGYKLPFYSTLNEINSKLKDRGLRICIKC
jgi:hypothetical protein